MKKETIDLFLSLVGHELERQLKDNEIRLNSDEHHYFQIPIVLKSDANLQQMVNPICDCLARYIRKYGTCSTKFRNYSEWFSFPEKQKLTEFLLKFSRINVQAWHWKSDNEIEEIWVTVFKA